MEEEYFIVDEATANTRLDKLLAEHYSDDYSRSYFQHLIDTGHVTLNGNNVKKQYRPLVGEKIRITFIPPSPIDLTPQNIPLDILYEDEDLIVINKIAGMVVHPAPGNWSGTFVNALLYHCGENLTSMEGFRPGIVHRLDKETSGVMIAAKNLYTHQKLVEAFSNRSVKKIYHAICLGNPGNGEIDAPIGRHPFKRKEMTILENGKYAHTQFKTLQFNGKISHVELYPTTGRTHQLRVHLKERRTPILGDTVYGQSVSNKIYKTKRQLLHAWQLSLTHPKTGALLLFQAPYPDDFKSTLSSAFPLFNS